METAPQPQRTIRFAGREQGAAVSFFVVVNAPGEGPSLHRHPYGETWHVLEGEATIRIGDDVIVAGAGHDLIDGGAGFDTLDLSAATGPIRVDFGINPNRSEDLNVVTAVADGNGARRIVPLLQTRRFQQGSGFLSHLVLHFSIGEAY